MNAWHYDVNAKSKMSFDIFAVVKTSTNGKAWWTYDNSYSTFDYHLEFVTKKSLPRFIN
jgi:hypothetical protein